MAACLRLQYLKFLQYSTHLRQTNRRQARDARYIYNACDSWRQLLPPTNSRQATAVRAAAKRDSTGRRPWLTPFRDCACSAACRGGWGRLSNPQLSQWDEEISRLTALVAGGLASSRWCCRIRNYYRGVGMHARASSDSQCFNVGCSMEHPYA